MPTGYTAEVANGNITEFPDFAKRCARAMGALVTMRDMSLDAPFPERIEADTDYYRKSLEGHVAELTTTVAWDEETADKEAHTSYLRAFKSHLQSVRSNRQQRKRYETMAAQVEAWVPPTEDHVGLKTFMAEQLASSIDFDTGYDPEKYRPVRLTGEEYKAQRIADLARSISYDTEHLFGEEDRAAEPSGWVQDLQASLTEWQPVELPKRYLP
jgi:hypothetical protein